MSDWFADCQQWDADQFERNLTDTAPRAEEFVKLLTKNAGTRQTRDMMRTNIQN